MRIGRRSTLVGLGLCATGAHAQTMHSGAIPVIPVRMATALGNIDLVLYIGKAPSSCKDFLKYIDAGLYDGGAFTRTVRPDNDHGTPKIDVVQGGIRPGASEWGPIALDSTRNTGLRHQDGTISLPRDGADTGSGGEFFICIGDQPALDAGGHRNKDGLGFAAFGQVTSGMEVVRRIWGQDATAPSADTYEAGQMLRHPVQIASIRRQLP